MSNMKLLLVLLTVTSIQGAIYVSPLFSDGVVFQIGKPIVVFGTSKSSGEVVTIRFRNQQVSSVSDSTRSWKVTLEPEDPAENTNDIMFIVGSNTIAIQNVQIGDVYVSAGSRIMTPLSSCNATAVNELMASPLLPRLKRYSKGKWTADPVSGSAQCLSAFFALERAKKTNNVVGIIELGSLSSAISPWTSTGSEYVYNVKPIQPFPINGILFDHGDRDAQRLYDAGKYESTLRTLIADWRRDWGIGSFPFYIVQLANEGSEGAPEIREAQQTIWMESADDTDRENHLSRIGFAITLDLEAPYLKDIINKHIVASRIAVLASYFDDENALFCSMCSGPYAVDSEATCRLDDHYHPYVRVFFDTGRDPLQIKNGSGPLIPGLEIIIDNSGVWEPAMGTLQGRDGIEIWASVSSASSRITSARYLFMSSVPSPVLESALGVPALPFLVENIPFVEQQQGGDRRPYARS